MKNLFSMDSPLFDFLTTVTNMVILSLLWTVFSIPIFTMGAATTALYSAQIRLLQDMDDHIVKNFWKSFRSDFRQSTLLFLIMIPLLGIVLLNALFIFGVIPGFPMLLRIGVGIVTALLLMYLEYLLPLTAQFENTIKQTMKNALFFMLRFLPQSAFAFLVGILPLAIVYFTNMGIVQALLFYTCVVVSLVAYVKMRIFRGLFMLYVPNEEAQSEESADEPTT